MTEHFDPARGLIIIAVEIFGPNASAQLKLALDTGATNTLIHPIFFQTIGYEISAASKRVKVTTGSGVELTPLISLQKIYALGLARESFPVLVHKLPSSATIDGLLGLDFFRDGKLELDFRAGVVQFES